MHLLEEVAFLARLHALVDSLVEKLNVPDDHVLVHSLAHVVQRETGHGHACKHKRDGS